MTLDHRSVFDHLSQLEQEMRALALWEDSPPAAEAFESKMPFCYDTMAFNQWLQWVFIPKTTELVSHRIGFPGKCEIEPMAEVWCEQNNVDHPQALLSAIGGLDRLLSA